MTTQTQGHRSTDRRPYPVWLAVVVLVLFVGPNLLSLVVGPSAPATVPRRELTDPQLVGALVATLVVQVGLFALALLPLLFARRLDGRLLGPTRPRLSARAVRAGLFTGIAATVGSYGINALLVMLTRTQEPVEQQLLQDALSGGSALLLVIVVAAIVAPITEEIVFRGVLFRSLADRFGAWTGVVASAAIFATIHVEVLLSQPVALAGLFVIGAILADSFRRTGNLLVPVLGHATFNATSLGLALLIDRVAPTAAAVIAG